MSLASPDFPQKRTIVGKKDRLQIPEKIQVSISGRWVQNMDNTPLTKVQQRVQELHNIFKQRTSYDILTSQDLSDGTTTRIMMFPIKAVDLSLIEVVKVGDRTFERPKDPEVGTWKHDHLGLAVCFYATNAGPNGQSGLLHALMILDKQSAINAVTEIRKNPGYLFTLIKKTNDDAPVRAANGETVSIIHGKNVVILPTSAQPFRATPNTMLELSAPFPEEYKAW